MNAGVSSATFLDARMLLWSCLLIVPMANEPQNVTADDVG